MKESEGIRWLVVSIVFVTILIIFFTLFIYYSDKLLGEVDNVNGVVNLINDSSKIFEQEGYNGGNCVAYKYNFPYKIPDNIVNSSIVKYNVTNNRILLENISRNRTLIDAGIPVSSSTTNYYIYGPFNLLLERSYKCLQDKCVGYDGNSYKKDETFKIYSRCTSLNSTIGQSSEVIDLTNNTLDQNSGELNGGRTCFISIGGQEYTGTITSTGYYIDYYGDYDSVGNLLSSNNKKYRLLSVEPGAANIIKTSNLGSTGNTGINEFNKMFHVIRGEAKAGSDGSKTFQPDNNAFSARIVTFINNGGFSTPSFLGFESLDDIQSGNSVSLIDFTKIGTSFIEWQLIPSFGLSPVQISVANNINSSSTSPNCKSIKSQYSYQMIAMPQSDNPIFYNDYNSFSKSTQAYFYMTPENFDFSNPSNIILQQLRWKVAPGYLEPNSPTSNYNLNLSTCEFQIQDESIKQQQFIFHDNIDTYNILFTNPLIQSFGTWNPNG